MINFNNCHERCLRNANLARLEEKSFCSTLGIEASAYKKIQ